MSLISKTFAPDRIFATHSSLGAPSGKLCAIRKGSVECHGEDGSLGRGVLSLYEDRKGKLWAGVLSGLWRWKPGPPQFYSPSNDEKEIQALGEDQDGALWIGMAHEMRRFVDGKIEPYPFPTTVRQFRAYPILRDREGGLWIGTLGLGLAHVHQGTTDVFGRSDGLSGDDVQAFFEDREGNIWVATVNGLDM